MQRFFDTGDDVTIFTVEADGTEVGHVPFVPFGAFEAVSGAGAASVTKFLTKWTTTSTDALTLADGSYYGQLKKILMIVDGGTGTLTPATFADGTSIAFADAGDFVTLMYTASGWRAIETGNTVDGISAPAIS